MNGRFRLLRSPQTACDCESPAAGVESALEQNTYRAAQSSMRSGSKTRSELRVFEPDRIEDSRAGGRPARGARLLRGSASISLRSVPWTLALTLLAIAPALAVDHNNIDAGRPLSFDDAETIAYREQALDLGLGLHWPRRRPLGAGLELEYLNGIALNTYVGIGLYPSFGGRADSNDTRFDFGDITLSALHNFRRETGGGPALSLRADAALPSGRDSKGADFRLRGILSRQADQYGRLHLNLDLNAAAGGRRREREFFPSAVVGYSRPIGMPRDFTTTGLAELGVTAGPERGRGPVLFAGIGIRKQISPRSVLDIGLQSDVAGWNGAARDRLRLVLGYSVSF